MSVLKTTENKDKSAYNGDMSRKVLFHGSSQVVEKPLFGHGAPTNDYGPGFYCTKEKEAAKEWACKSGEEGVLNKYDIDERGLKILYLDKEHGFGVLNWLTLLLEHRTLGASFIKLFGDRVEFLKRRYRVDISSYDVVVGYRADDAYFAFPKAFIDGSLTLESLEKVFELGNLGKQYVLISEKAFSAIRFIESIPVDRTYVDKYNNKMVSANDDYARYLTESAKDIRGTRITDLMKHE